MPPNGPPNRSRALTSPLLVVVAPVCVNPLKTPPSSQRTGSTICPVIPPSASACPVHAEFACIDVSPTACSQPRLPTPSIVAASVCATDPGIPVCRRCESPASALTCHCARAEPGKPNAANIARPTAAAPRTRSIPQNSIRTRPGFPLGSFALQGLRGPDDAGELAVRSPVVTPPPGDNSGVRPRNRCRRTPLPSRLVERPSSRRCRDPRTASDSRLAASIRRRSCRRARRALRSRRAA